MKNTFLLLILIMLFMMVLSAVIFMRKKRIGLKSLLVLNISSFVTLSLYILNLYIRDEFYATLIMGMYYASLDWLLFSLLNSVMTFNQVIHIKSKSYIFMYIFIVLAGLDTASMILNAFFHHVFRILPVYIDNEIFCWISHIKGGLFYIHLILCYLVVVNICMNLIDKYISSVKYFRAKYRNILFIFIFVVLCNFTFMIFKQQVKLDYSLLNYGFISILLCYYNLYSTPKIIRNRTLKLISENMNNAIVCFDKDRNCIYANNLASKIYGDKLKNCDEQYFSLKTDQIIRREEIFVNGKKHTFVVEYRYLKDNKGRNSGSYLNLEDITDEIESIKKETYKSTHDALTGLYNRKTFFLKATELLRRSPDIPRYLICTNIKHFKLVNDLFGTAFGDSVLIQQAKMLNLSDYPDCIKGRISGDKFAMIINKENFRPDLADLNTRKILNFTKDINYKLHMHIGIYEISNPYEDIKSMFDKANLAINNLGDDQNQIVTYYDSSIMEKLVEEKSVVSEFSDAINNKEFCIYLQPEVNCKTKKIIGAESLVRWIHPVKGLIMPDKFIGILERTGYIYKLDTYIWEQAVKLLSEWKKKGCDYYISVNISAKDFYYIDLYDVFTSLIEKYNVEPGKLNLEITETVLMNDINLHLAELKKLKDFGFKVEMDDFGNGYSSLNMLKDINVDVLKIDRNFLKQTDNEDRSKIILKSVLRMVKNLGITVVAEGVETEKQIQFLIDNNCDMFQGYYFSEPLKTEIFEKKYLYIKGE